MLAGSPAGNQNRRRENAFGDVHGFSFRIKKDCDLPFHIERTGVKQNTAIDTIAVSFLKCLACLELHN